MKHVKTFAIMGTALALAACGDEPTPPAGQPAVGSASDLSAFEGARAGQAEMGIQNLGFALVRSEGLTSYWFNSDTGACAEITTADGRYSAINMVSAGECV